MAGTTGHKRQLFQSCCDGNLQLVDRLLSTNEGLLLVHCEDSNGRTALILCAIHGHADIAASLLCHGARTNAHDSFGRTALMEACRRGHEKVVELLINRGAVAKHDLLLAFMSACGFGHANVVEVILNKPNGVNDIETTKLDPTPLMKACESGNVDVVTLLIKRGAYVNATGLTNGQTALSDACRNGYEDTVKVLIHRGADVNICDKNGISPLMGACRKGHRGVVDILIQRGADVNASDETGETALMRACRGGYVDIVELLIAHGVDLNACDKRGEMALMMACVHGHVPVVELLLQHCQEEDNENRGGTGRIKTAFRKMFYKLARLLQLSKRLGGSSSSDGLNLTDNYGETLLMKASWHGQVEVVAWLLNRGVEVDAKGRRGDTALMRASENGRHEVVDLLAERGACVNVAVCGRTGRRAYTPVMVAVESGRVGVLETLIRRGGVVNLLDEHGVTTLMKACHAGQLKVVELLLESDGTIDVNERSKENDSGAGGGLTALMMVCRCRSKRSKSDQAGIVELLLRHGALLDIVDTKHERSAAMMAVIEDKVECLESMLPWGPNLDLEDANGLTVFTYAMGLRNSNCLKVLLVDSVLLDAGCLKPAHRKSDFVCRVFENLMLTLHAGVFEWHWCPLEHYKSMTIAALQAGLCPPSMTNNNNCNNPFSTHSPFVTALMRFDRGLIESLLKRLYFFPEDYASLCTDVTIRDQTFYRSIYNRIALQPMSLQTWSFLTISKSISLSGPPGLRWQRVNSLPIPDRLKRKLNFKEE